MGFSARHQHASSWVDSTSGNVWLGDGLARLCFALDRVITPPRNQERQ